MVAIRNSAKALVIEQNCVLAISMQDDNGQFFTLPGGGQESGENLADTVRRECREELGREILVHELCFVREHIHPLDHRVEFMFRCSLDGILGERIPTRPDAGQQGPVWIPLSELPSLRFYPLGLRSILGQVQSQTGPVYLGDLE